MFRPRIDVFIQQHINTMIMYNINVTTFVRCVLKMTGLLDVTDL